VYLQMALALAHAEEGAWLTLAPFSSAHTLINTESLIQACASKAPDRPVEITLCVTV
jgi:hypothetical protein